LRVNKCPVRTRDPT